MSSPIMMLWFDLRVRTNIALIASLLLHGGRMSDRTARRWRPIPRRQGYLHPRRGVPVSRRIAAAAHSLVCPADGTEIASPPAQPDPHVGPPRPHRRLDRPPARGHDAADRVVQAREPARARRGGRPRRRPGSRLRRRDRPARRGRRADRGRAGSCTAGAREGRGGGRQEEPHGPRPASPPQRPKTTTPRTARTARARAAAAAAGVADAARHPPGRSRARSTTATRATACGSTRPCRTTLSTPSTGRATAPSRSRSKRTRS